MVQASLSRERQAIGEVGAGVRGQRAGHPRGGRESHFLVAAPKDTCEACSRGYLQVAAGCAPGANGRPAQALCWGLQSVRRRRAGELSCPGRSRRVGRGRVAAGRGLCPERGTVWPAVAVTSPGPEREPEV